MEFEAASSPSTQLTDLQRAEVLAHTRYPKLGPWYPPTFGAAAAAFTAAYALPIWASLIVWIVLVAVFGVLARAYVDRRGTLPDARRAPAPIKREMTYFFVGYTLLIAVIVAVYLTAAWWAAAAVAFAGFTIGIAVYEHRYADAARRVELDAGIGA